ncbi:hypothetical protein [Hymenobacter sp. BRD67]|uniref:hypothetical protein n=1 Tax=Hymenobacter sp. BRD67 TaxID=2675877 RepID=UPI001565FBEE|nr:hypothetical protein [Hymenobacter sp. BRD67]QKG54886.1 hypothetical protein GKZ67_20885 [Hymenobacter sp. BRD67]
MLLRHHLPLVADLGGEVLDAMVETAAYVVQQAPPIAQPTTFLRLLNVPGDEKEAALQEGMLNLASPLRFEVPTTAFKEIPGSAFSYWAGLSILSQFSQQPAFKPSAGYAAVGLQTSDDLRFVRLWYECFSNNWKPFSKGGRFSLFYGPLDTNVLWGENGLELKAWAHQVGGAGQRTFVQFIFTLRLV